MGDRKSCFNGVVLPEDTVLPKNKSWIKGPRGPVSRSMQAKQSKTYEKKTAIEVLKEQTFREIGQIKNEMLYEKKNGGRENHKYDIRPGHSMMINGF